MGITTQQFEEMQQRLAANRAKSKPLPTPVTRPALANVELRESTDVERLNKTEAAFLVHLRYFKFPWIGVQSLTLKLGDDCRYTPDFVTIGADGRITAWEVKGFWRDDARVKIKTAAREFTWMKFIAVQKNRKKDGAGWSQEEIRP